MVVELEDVPAYESEELIEILKKLSLEERAIRFFNFLNFTREMQWAGIKARNPGFSDEEVDRKFKEDMLAYYKSD